MDRQKVLNKLWARSGSFRPALVADLRTAIGDIDTDSYQKEGMVARLLGIHAQLRKQVWPFSAGKELCGLVLELTRLV